MIRALKLWRVRWNIRAQEEWRADLIDGIATGQTLLRQCERRLEQMRAEECLLTPYRQVIKRALL